MSEINNNNNNNNKETNSVYAEIGFAFLVYQPRAETTGKTVSEMIHDASSGTFNYMYTHSSAVTVYAIASLMLLRQRSSWWRKSHIQRFYHQSHSGRNVYPGRNDVTRKVLSHYTFSDHGTLGERVQCTYRTLWAAKRASLVLLYLSASFSIVLRLYTAENRNEYSTKQQQVT